MWDYASDAWEEARIARFKARKAATAKAIAARLLRSVLGPQSGQRRDLRRRQPLFAFKRRLDHFTTGEPTLRLWQVDTGKSVMTYNGHSGGVAGIAVTPTDCRRCRRDTTTPQSNIGI